MANRAFVLSSVYRRSALAAARKNLPTRGGGHVPRPAPFARLSKPTRPLTEEHELIWDDGVAPWKIWK